MVFNYDINNQIVMSKRELKKLFGKCWEACDTGTKVSISNIYTCKNIDGASEIFENDEDFFNERYRTPFDAVKAVCWGRYNDEDAWVWLGEQGIFSTSNEKKLPFEKTSVMAEWFIENYEELDFIMEMEEFCQACEK